jgi:osmotically-inducible protein OsmY
MKTTWFTALACSALITGCCCPHGEEHAKFESSSSVAVYGAATTTTTYSSSSQTAADSALVSEVRAAINNDPMLTSIAPSIQVIANNGTVTLIGNVSNEDQKLRVDYLAKGTSGVVTVNNQLQVPPRPSGRSSQSSLYYNSPRQLQSSASASDSDQPSRRLYTNGSPVRNDLSPTSERPVSRLYSQAPSGGESFNLRVQGSSDADQKLADQVRQALRAETSLSGAFSRLTISLDNGKATLHGLVKSEDDKQRVETAVQKITGVTSVQNDLRVGDDSNSRSPIGLKQVQQ